jgi:hypothetical protein
VLTLPRAWRIDGNRSTPNRETTDIRDNLRISTEKTAAEDAKNDWKRSLHGNHQNEIVPLSKLLKERRRTACLADMQTVRP